MDSVPGFLREEYIESSEVDKPENIKFAKINKVIFRGYNTSDESVRQFTDEILLRCDLDDCLYHKDMVKSVASLYNSRPESMTDGDVFYAIDKVCSLDYIMDIESLEQFVKLAFEPSSAPTQIHVAKKLKNLQQAPLNIDYVADSSLNEYQQLKSLGYRVKCSTKDTGNGIVIVDKLKLYKGTDPAGLSIPYLRDIEPGDLITSMVRSDYSEKSTLSKIVNTMLDKAIQLEGYNSRSPKDDALELEKEIVEVKKAVKLKI